MFSSSAPAFCLLFFAFASEAAEKAEDWVFGEASSNCFAATSNSDGTILGYKFARTKAQYTASIYNPQWHLPVSSVPLVLRFEASGVTPYEVKFDAAVRGGNSLDLNSYHNTERILAFVVHSQNLFIFDNAGKFLAHFSLQGSQVAIINAMSCQEGSG